MWGGSGVDSGGTKESPPGQSSNQELVDLKDQFEQQQVLIAQLKEMLRKTEQTTVTQEKVEEYANTLTRMNARAKKGKLKKKEGESDRVGAKQPGAIDSPANEKLMLLRQQVEENKQRLVERGKFQKGIEETVTQLKAQFDDSQQLISQTPVNLSFAESKTENYSISSTSEDLFNLVLSKEKKLTELTAKIQKLEGNVLDLQENVKEKDSVIDARTKAITLMTESLSKKGKNTLDALDDTKEQMRRMQENFVLLEMDLRNEKQQLLNELDEKKVENERLQVANNILENTCTEQKNEIARLANSTQEDDPKIAELNNQIIVLNNRIIELEEPSTEASSRDSPQRSGSAKKGKKGQKQKPKQKDEDSDKIKELQKLVNDANIECETHLNKITEYELTISELNLSIEQLKTKPIVRTDTAVDSEETAKLKKQLDDSNKNMIKIKAQNKGKLKELNKKIDELKKASENNEELIRLQTENSKLNEHIDMLEEEKANLGLDTSYTLSNKGDPSATDRVKELEIKLLEQSELLGSQNQAISTQSDEIKAYKAQIDTLTQLENAQVVSEITSIHFEEQLDKLEMEKSELLGIKEHIMQEKEALLEKIEILTKEKQELNIKLDNYMQENMDLIDKLEKLSAEKVSSAESIEIVEGLTQQEKLELEEYQKGLEMASGDVKNSEENLNQHPELDESVNQLTEETSDLLRKIELFTEERREVMEKMESLSAENNQLSSKIREIENNRDVLVETYEQVQNEKEDLEHRLELEKENTLSLQSMIDDLRNQNEILKQTDSTSTSTSTDKTSELQMEIDEYKKLVEIQKQEINELKIQLLAQEKQLRTANDLEEKISSLQSEYNLLLTENERLQKISKELSEVVQEKDSLQAELTATKQRIDDFNEKLNNNVDEIENYKSIVEDSKNELISSSNIINDLGNKLQEKENEISHYAHEIVHLNSVISELNSAISHLESENCQNSENDETLELMSNQLQELKVLLSENIKKIEIYEADLQDNSDTIFNLNTELMRLSEKLLEMEHEMESKSDEIKKLQKEHDNKEMVIYDLQRELKEKDDKFHHMCDTLKEKCFTLQRQIEENTGSLDNIKDPLPQIEALQTKNKEQLEKMKKIAANLKKKTTAYQELEAKFNDSNEKWEVESKAKVHLKEIIATQETTIIESRNKIDSLLEQLQEIECEFSTAQSTLQLKAYEVEQLKTDNDVLQNLRLSCESQLNEFTRDAEMRRSDESNNLNLEICAKNEIIKNLNRELETVRYNSETSSNALLAKIQELEMFVETQEGELTKYKEKVNKLEEGLSTVEERRMSLEQKTIELGAQLQEKSNSYEEISQTEDLLEQRLAALMLHDEKMERHLRETSMENQELVEHNRYLMEETDKLRLKLSVATEKNLDASMNEEKLLEIQNENAKLNNSIATLENDCKRLHSEHEQKLVQKKNEIDVLELELQGQLEQKDTEHKTLLIRCEHLEDKVKENEDNQEILKEEIEQYKQKIEQQQVDFDAYINEYQKISDENQGNLRFVEQLKLELTSNQVNNQELQTLITEKDNMIEKYRLENLQLQMQENVKESEHFEVVVNPQLESHIQSLTKELQDARNRIQEVEKHSSQLVLANTDLMDQIAQGQQNVTNQGNKLTEESQKSTVEQPLSTFLWPSQSSNDPFDFITDPIAPVEPSVITTMENKLDAFNIVSSRDPVGENSREELLNKIKTLEFMLFNAEKEKDEALSQCQDLTNEIARLIYEQQALDTRVRSVVTDTVLPPEEYEQLRNIEFAWHENVTDNRNTVQTHDHTALLEEQICSEPTARITQEDLKALRDLEFETIKSCTDQTDFANAQQIQEDTMQRRSAYLCYEQDNAQNNQQEPATSQAITSLDIFDENDDGWGCGSEEARLEDDFSRRTQRPPMNLNLNLHIEELDERIRILEVERERHLEEIKQAQIKSGKLIKKLKEFKALNEKLTNDLRKADFGGLDDAIQDELQSQILNLEKKIKECSVEHEKEKNDKSNLIKKIDILQTANDRMTDLKEKHETEIISWQRQNRELSARLEQVEWGNENYDSPRHVQKDPQTDSSEGHIDVEELKKEIQNLKETMNELTLDNEDLQTMLEEQRALRIETEKAKSVEPILENMKTETEFLNLLSEKNCLNAQLLQNTEQMKGIQEEINNAIKKNEELQQNVEKLEEKNTQLTISLTKNDATTVELKEQLHNALAERENSIHISKETINNEVQLSRIRISDLEQTNSELTNTLQVLQGTIDKLNTENGKLLDLKQLLEMSNQEKTKLFNDVQYKEKQIGDYEEKIALLSEQLNTNVNLINKNEKMINTIKSKDSEIAELNNKLESALQEGSNLSTSIQQLADEWSQRVDQRGADIAESWKLHLESRETEFMQIEQKLRKDLNELEEKCNVLVNENNELRKNVDAEIRNEVDKISALQQQINDRQHYINDLTSVVQEKQDKLSENEAQISQLGEQIQDKDKKLLSLESDLIDKSNVIQQLNGKLDELKHLQQQLTESQKNIVDLDAMLTTKQSAIDDYLGKLDKSCIENDSLKRSLEGVKYKMEEDQERKKLELDSIPMLNEQIIALNTELKEKEDNLQSLNQEFHDILHAKDMEMNEYQSDMDRLTTLVADQEQFICQMEEKQKEKETKVSQLQMEMNHIKSILNEKEREYAYSLATTSQESESIFHEKAQELDIIKRRQAESQIQFDEVMSAKESDMEILRLQLQEQINKNTELAKECQNREDAFNSHVAMKEQECNEMRNNMYEQDALHNEENNLLVELRTIIEDQVLKIEGLKQQLFDKSKDYDSLIAELDIRKPSRSTPSTPTSEHQDEIVKESDESPKQDQILDQATRVEMDLALYMLHQRDVRCEELTVELMQLLEERDTLQLKLSNAIREKEELRGKLLPRQLEYDSQDDTAPTTPISSTVPKSRSSAVFSAAGTELVNEATEPTEEKETLATKLSELKSVGYRKDKTLLDEQSQRRLQQLSFMQHHRDVAALLPQEAADRLVQDANYTLSRDVQSPPRVLLNWLWGRSTPKVVNDI